MKFEAATGALEYSSTLGSGLKEITAFIPNGTELLAAVNTNPIKLVTVTRNRLVVGSVFSLTAGTPTLMDPIVVGTTAYLGTDATPGRITAIDIPTKTVVGSAVMNTGEVGARNLVVDESTGTLYATTSSTSGPRIASFRLTDLSRLGTTQLNPGTTATSLLIYGRTLAAGFEGTRGVETFTVAPEPNAPTIVGVQHAAASLVVDHRPGATGPFNLPATAWERGWLDWSGPSTAAIDWAAPPLRPAPSPPTSRTTPRSFSTRPSARSTPHVRAS
jgi:hypothetical protein